MFSLSNCLDVVPDEISEWKPETEPQATVMNNTGNTKLPLASNAVKACNCTDG